MIETIDRREEDQDEVLFPIKKIYSDALFEGVKGYEYRKSRTKTIPKYIHVYESEGNKKVVGYLGVRQIMSGTPQEIWNETKDFSGIEEKDYFKYFDGCETAYAYVIGSVHRFARPKTLEDYDLKFAPQSRVWIVRGNVRFRGEELKEDE